MRLEYYPQAIADLIEIGNYIRQDNVEAAEKLLMELEVCCDLLIQSPSMGRPRNELATGIRSIPHKNYVIFYLCNDDAVSIVRVLHSARDVNSFFGSN